MEGYPKSIKDDLLPVPNYTSCSNTFKNGLPWANGVQGATAEQISHDKSFGNCPFYLNITWAKMILLLAKFDFLNAKWQDIFCFCS